jgi:hypothetical protein
VPGRDAGRTLTPGWAASWAVASGTHWALGIQARAEALSMKDQAAEDRYREAIERLGRCRVATHLARAHLVYGEWLRREGRRRDARAQLHAAHDLLAAMGAEAFAARAARELRAIGDAPASRPPSPPAS